MTSVEKTVYVVDDDAAVGKSTSFFLGSAGFQTRSYHDGRSFVADVAKLHPGCVLLDIRMPGMDGFQVIAALEEYRTRLPIIIMTGHGDVATAVRAMKAGAADFIEKPYEEDVLLDILATAFSTLDGDLVATERRAAARAKMMSLSDREDDVLRGLIGGHSNKVLAYRLGISIRTVEAHRAAMMGRLGVRTLAEALRLAFDAGPLVRERTGRVDVPAVVND